MNKTRKKIIEIVENIGFLTGSRKFGTETEDSDWDYVILFSDFKKTIRKKKYRDKIQ
ncbi:MAG: nucleotidyltransferase domain-containing protein [Candidatus Tenebribacter davisii]|nr:nucleotidyltransferase domain-containing protein [Candidatus Tenebribacter davisii]